MRFLIRQFTPWLEHTDRIVKAPFENAYKLTLPYTEKTFPSTMWENKVSYEVPTWEDWLSEGTDHKKVEYDYSGTTYSQEYREHKKYYYSRVVEREYWFVDIETTEELNEFLNVYNVRVYFDVDEPYILFGLDSRYGSVK